MNRRTASRADTRLNSKSALFALIGLILAPLSVAHASPSPADSVLFCGLSDYEHWRRDHPLPAGKRLADRNVGEPRTVRMIYFLPNDRPFRQEVVDLMKVRIREVQTFFADQMQAHGYGNTTFRFETDAQGEPLVHRVDGLHRDEHYYTSDTASAIFHEIEQVFDLAENIYLIVIDNSTGIIISGGDSVGGVAPFFFSGSADRGYEIIRFAVVPSSLLFGTVAHELGHTFGLGHDFRDATYIMSYGWEPDRLSTCAAELLSVRPYFNPNSPLEGTTTEYPTIEIISPLIYPASSTSVSIRIKVGASKGLHQVILSDRMREPNSNAGLIGVATCRGLAGKKDAVVEFKYDVTIPPFGLSPSSPVGHWIGVSVVDKKGTEAYKGFNLIEKSPYYIASLHDGSFGSVSFSPDGTLIAAGGSDGLFLWDVASRRQVATLHVENFRSLSFSPDGTLIAVGSRDGLFLWDVASRRQVATLDDRDLFHFGSVSFSPDGTLIASGSAAELFLWDVASRRQVATLHDGFAQPVSFSPDGTLIAGRASDEFVLWDVASRRQVATLHDGSFGSVSFSPDGTLIAGGGWDGLFLWDVASRRQVATLHDGSINSLSFSPDGTLIASGSAAELFLWDVTSRRQVAIFLHPGTINSLSFSPDGTLIASATGNGLLLWDVAEVEPATPQTLTKVSGDSQQGPANTRLAKPFVVSALDQDNSPVAGVRVAFSTGGGALLSPTSHADPCAVGSSASSIASYTDANGQASVRLTLGSQVAYSVKATVEGLEPVTFTAIKSGQASPQRLAKVCGDSQEGIAGEQLAEPFVVSVSAENGAAIAGVAVSFAVTAGGGTLSSATATTDANGRAATRLTLGSEAGANTVTGTVEGLGSVTFTATGQEPPASLFDLFLGGGKLASLPDRTQLLQNAPNPFNSQTVLSYFLPEPSPMRLEVFALTGQRVAVLHQGPQQAGYHRLHWDGRDATGHPVASGAYLYRLMTDEAVLTRKLILLR